MIFQSCLDGLRRISKQDEGLDENSLVLNRCTRRLFIRCGRWQG